MGTNLNTTDFNNVDKSGNTDFFIKSIDTYSTIDLIKEYKQKTVKIQGIQKGYNVLDVGCGTGEDIAAIASIVGKDGRAVGIDFSSNLLEEAAKRHIENDRNLEFYQGDAQALNFDDNSFDCSRADLVFHFLNDPCKALMEMVRVTKEGGSILVVNADFDSVLIDSDNRDVTRKVIHYRCDQVDGWVSRRLYRLFKDCNLKNIVIEPITLTVNKFGMANMLFDLENIAQKACDAGVLTQDEVTTWINELKDKDANDRFFGSITGFIVAGTK